VTPNLKASLTVAALACLAAVPVSAQNLSPLHASGTSYVDATGKTVRLHGVNLGSWLLMEPWMCPMDNSGAYSDMYGMMQELDSRFGVAGEQDLIRTYQQTWTTTADLQNIKNAGLNCIRVPVWWANFYTLSSYGDASGWRSDAFDNLDWLVNQCSTLGIYVVIDMHGVVGGQSNSITCGQANSNAYWTNTTYQARTAALWKAIATHYKGNGTVAGYDLINEPIDTPSKTAVWTAYDSLYHGIRTVDPDHIIIMEGAFGNWNWDMLPPPSTYGWTNVAYEMHEYQFGGSSSQVINGAQNQVNDYRNHLSWNVPEYLGEFNNMGTGVATWDQAVSLYNHNDISWSMWSYKAANGLVPNSWGFYDPTSWQWTPNVQTDSAYWIGFDWGMWSTTSSFALNTGIALPSIPVANGLYTLTPQCATGSRLDAAGSGTTNGTGVQIWQNSSNKNQAWSFSNLGGSFYKIQPSYSSGLALDVSGGSTANGTHVDLWADNGSKAQQWSVDPNGDGTYTLVPACAPNAALDVTGVGSANGTPIQIWQASSGDTAQMWTLTSLTTTPPSTTIALSGATGSTGAYDAAVQVTLTATDPNGPSYLAGTFYTVDGGGQQTYSVPFVLTGDGVHTVTYWSVDTLGNVETAHTQQITIKSQLASITVSPGSVTGGVGATATVTLTGVAPAGGALIKLSTSAATAAKFSATSVTVPAGATSITAPVVTFPVIATTSVTLTAKYGVSHTCHITVLVPKVGGLKVLPSKIAGGAAATGTVTLTGTAAANTTVTVTSGSACATIAGAVIVPAGSNSTTFTVNTTPVAVDTAAAITATANGASATSTITVKIPVLDKVSLSPATVHSGGSTTLTATLQSPAPAGGIAVDLVYVNGTALSTAPSSITVPGGSTTGTATIIAGTVSAQTAVNISATLGTTNKSTTLTVKP